MVVVGDKKKKHELNVYAGNSFSKKAFKSLYTLLSMNMHNTNGVN